MLLKKCPRCGTIIPQSSDVCEKCAGKAKSRHMDYNLTRRDQRSAKFYISKPWKLTSKRILEIFDHIDIYAYYVNHEIVAAERVHHIVELKEDWERCLDPSNLIPLSLKNHGIITAIYNKNAFEKERMQRQLISLVERHFADRGGIIKIFNLNS